jgi:hypothetical protein
VSDIFISYASADRERAIPVVDALRQKGWSVWWDRIVPPGKTWDQVIETALDEARCVIVLWSRDSVLSDWVKTEADEGKRRGILVPVLIDAVKIPLAFRRVQAADLVGWSGILPNAGFDELAGAVSEILAVGASKPPARAATAFAATTPDSPTVERMGARREPHAPAVIPKGHPQIGPRDSLKGLIAWGGGAVGLVGIGVGALIYIQSGRARVEKMAAPKQETSISAPVLSTGPSPGPSVVMNKSAKTSPTKTMVGAKVIKIFARDYSSISGTLGVNVLPYGKDVLTDAPGMPEAGARTVSYIFKNPNGGGPHTLSFCYAAAVSRPVLAVLNGKQTNSTAAGDVTGGWYPEERKCISAGRVVLNDGGNEITLQSDRPFPHIWLITFSPTN